MDTGFSFSATKETNRHIFTWNPVKNMQNTGCIRYPLLILQECLQESYLNSVPLLTKINLSLTTPGMPISIDTNPKAVHIWFTDEKLFVRLEDGREIGVPLEWYPKLLKATQQQRANWRLIAKGVGIHWDDLDEDLSVEKMIHK
jgi:hypothetical protein